MKLVKTDDALLNAVQLIDQHIHFIHSHVQEFCLHLGITDAWTIERVKFEGPYLAMVYIDKMDTTKKIQVPLFDYVAWRNKLGR